MKIQHKCFPMGMTINKLSSNILFEIKFPQNALALYFLPPLLALSLNQHYGYVHPWRNYLETHCIVQFNIIFNAFLPWAFSWWNWGGMELILCFILCITYEFFLSPFEKFCNGFWAKNLNFINLLNF